MKANNVKSSNFFMVLTSEVVLTPCHAKLLMMIFSSGRWVFFLFFFCSISFWKNCSKSCGAHEKVRVTFKEVIECLLEVAQCNG